jgi:peptidoglycan hydrolase-like protein with peptidoglycan-binding domain
MTRKIKIILITAIIVIGASIYGYFYVINKKTASVQPGTASDGTYNSFNPITTSTGTTDTQVDPASTTNTGGAASRFHQITNFPVAGATFFMDSRPIVLAPGSTPLEVTTVIPADTKEGRKEIQAILNQTLSLKPPLTVDGNFGKSSIQAIKDFQKLNNIPITGTVDAATAPLFTKTSAPTNEIQYEPAPSIKYVERVTGHVDQMYLDTKVTGKVSNTTIPNIYEAIFDARASTIIYRYLATDGSKAITSFIATLGGAQGAFLPSGITDASVSPDKTKFFYLTETASGVMGTIKSFTEPKTSQVFNSPFTEWLSQWVTDQKIYLTTKASGSVQGNLFSLNTANGTLTKIFGGVQGLTTLSNSNGSKVLFSTSSSLGPKLGILDVASHTTNDTSAYSLPEKCVWSADNITAYCAIPNDISSGVYPDSWYQGLVSFEDHFVKIDTGTGSVIEIVSSPDTPMDGTHLFLDNTESQLFFINKKDSMLWSIDLK